MLQGNAVTTAAGRLGLQSTTFLILYTFTMALKAMCSFSVPVTRGAGTGLDVAKGGIVDFLYFGISSHSCSNSHSLRVAFEDRTRSGHRSYNVFNLEQAKF